jgi:hypothetical protein
MPDPAPGMFMRFRKWKVSTGLLWLYLTITVIRVIPHREVPAVLKTESMDSEREVRSMWAIRMRCLLSDGVQNYHVIVQAGTVD